MYKKFFIFICSFSACLAIDIGSDTVVSRFDAQQSLNNGDRIAGFAWLNAGFELASNSVSGTFDSLYPVGDTTDLNGGELILGQDLIFHNVATLGSLGDVIGWGHKIYLAASQDCVPTTGSSTCYTWSEIGLIIDCDVMLKDCCITFTGNSSISGRGFCLTLDSTCTLQVAANSSLLVKDITIKNVHEKNIQSLDSSSTFSFENVRFVLSDDYVLDAGNFDVIKDFEIAGDGKTFNYETDQVSTISSCGRLILDEGVTFNYDPSTSDQGLLQFSDSSSEFILRSATLAAGTDGLRLTNGYMQIEGKSFLSAQGVSAATGILFGDGTSAASNWCIEWLPAATLELLQGFATYDNV